MSGLMMARSKVEPRAAPIDLVGVRPLMQPALAAHFELEMLHRIGDEDFAAI
jgi:hypothetical protein